MLVGQFQLVHIPLVEPPWRLKWNSSEQQFAIARWLSDAVAQVGDGGVEVSELQSVRADDLSGAVLQAEAGVVVQGWWDAIAVLDSEVEGSTPGRDTVSHNKTVEKEK